MRVDKSQNGKWVLTTAVSIGAMLVGLGVGWGSKTSAVDRQTEDIRQLKIDQKADHDCIVEVKTKLVAIEATLLEIKTILKEQN